MTIRAALALAAALAALSAAPRASAAETRCGWIVNPTPGNWWLTDRDGEWTLSVQGGYEAPGLDKLPDMSGPQWVTTNAGDHGYGCACLGMTVDRHAMRATKILSAAQKPLAACRSDHALKSPG